MKIRDITMQLAPTVVLSDGEITTTRRRAVTLLSESKEDDVTIDDYVREILEHEKRKVKV